METVTTKKISSDLLDDMDNTFYSNFDYSNEVYVEFEDEFKEEYGKVLADEYGVNATELIRVATGIFKDRWYAMLGEIIEHETPDFQECLTEAQEELQVQKERSAS